MKELPLFIKIFLVIVLGAMSVLFGATALQKKERGLDDSETPREILSVQKGNDSRPTNNYIVLMKDRTVKKFIDVGSDGIIDEVLRPDNVGWTEEFKDDQKRAKAMFAEVLKLKMPKESH